MLEAEVTLTITERYRMELSHNPLMCHTAMHAGPSQGQAGMQLLPSPPQAAHTLSKGNAAQPITGKHLRPYNIQANGSAAEQARGAQPSGQQASGLNALLGQTTTGLASNAAPVMPKGHPGQAPSVDGVGP